VDWRAKVVVLADGSIAVVYRDRYLHTNGSESVEGERLVVVSRSTAGWGPARILSSQPGAPAAAAAIGAAGLLVAWCERSPAGSAMLVSEIEPGAAKTGPVVVSRPGTDACSNGTVSIAANAAGAAALAWSRQALPEREPDRPPLQPAPFGSEIWAAAKDTRGSWTTAELLDAAARGPGVAINAGGAAFVTWATENGFGSTSRGGAGGFAPPARQDLPLPAPGRDHGNTATFLTDRGNRLLLRWAGGSSPSGAPTSEYSVLTGTATGGLGDQRTVAGPAEISRLSAGRDAFGNGTFVWSENNRLMASSFSEAPPRIRGVSVGRTAVRMRVSEPARLAITLDSGARRATQRARAIRAGTVVVPMDPQTARAGEGRDALGEHPRPGRRGRHLPQEDARALRRRPRRRRQRSSAAPSQTRAATGVDSRRWSP